MSTATATAAAEAPPGKKRARTSDRSKAENRLGQKLVLPAVIVMLLVTAWPMIQAIYLSLFRYRLTTPDDANVPTTARFSWRAVPLVAHCRPWITTW